MDHQERKAHEDKDILCWLLILVRVIPVKDLPKISKPYDSICKPCQMGKLTCIQFKSKNFTSTDKPPL